MTAEASLRSVGIRQHTGDHPSGPVFFGRIGRPLTADGVAHVRDPARRIAALLGPGLDANYAAVTADPYPWPR